MDRISGADIIYEEAVNIVAFRESEKFPGRTEQKNWEEGKKRLQFYFDHELRGKVPYSPLDCISEIVRRFPGISHRAGPSGEGDYYLKETGRVIGERALEYLTGIRKAVG